MGLAPISVELTDYEKIEILRHEIELREEELSEAEKSIRSIMYELERQRYLGTIHALFQQLPQPEEAAALPQLQANREGLSQAIQTMKAALQALEGAMAGAAPQGAPAQRPGLPQRQPSQAGGQRVRFDSFEQFRQQRKGGLQK